MHKNPLDFRVLVDLSSWHKGSASRQTLPPGFSTTCVLVTRLLLADLSEKVQHHQITEVLERVRLHAGEVCVYLRCSLA